MTYPRFQYVSVFFAETIYIIQTYIIPQLKKTLNPYFAIEHYFFRYNDYAKKFVA